MNGLTFDYVAVAVFAIGAIYGLQRGALRMVTSAVALPTASIARRSITPRRESWRVAARFIAHGWRGGRLRPGIRADVHRGGNYRHICDPPDPVVHMGPLDRLAGGVLGAGVAGVFAGLAVMLLAAVMPPDAALLHDSQLVPMLLAYNEMLVGYIPGDAKLAYQRNRDDLMKYWVQNAMKVTNSMPSPAASPSPSAN